MLVGEALSRAGMGIEERIVARSLQTGESWRECWGRIEHADDGGFFFNSVCLLLSCPFSQMRNHTAPRECWALSASSALEDPLVCGEIARWLQSFPGGFRHLPILVLVYQGRHLDTQWSKQTSGHHRAQPFLQSRTASDTRSGQLWLCLLKSWIIIKVFSWVQNKKKVAVQGYVLVNRVEDVPRCNTGHFCPLTMGNTFFLSISLPWHFFILWHVRNGTSCWIGPR